ncbi:MAG: CBS domain-containing protein [Steroidobacteraceae bacterium]
MQVNKLMTRDVRIAAPDQTLQQAARLMAELDTGVLPVGENDRLVGMITDRDITIRAVAEGLDPTTPVRQIMSPEVKYVFEDQEVDEVSIVMSELQVRRLPVVDRSKRLVGILSLGDMAVSDRAMDEAGEALSGVSQPTTPKKSKDSGTQRLS